MKNLKESLDKNINPHLVLGKINTLRIDRKTDPGLFLMADDGKDVLLPNQYITNEMLIDTLLDVFLYTDSEDRLIATTLKPLAMLNEFSFFEVVDITPFGAFVDWGLPKDLLVPKKLQKSLFKIGEKRFLKVIYDDQSHRLVGTEKVGSYFDKKIKGIYPNQMVELMVIAKTPLGFKVIVNNKYEGLLFHNEIFEVLSLGDKKIGYVKTIRKDGKLDVTLNKIGKNNDGANIILELLEKEKGMLPYNYKSDPELIKKIFQMSKKEFKRSLTLLQNDGKIIVKDTGIYKTV